MNRVVRKICKNIEIYIKEIKRFISRNPKATLLLLSLFLFWFIARILDLGSILTADEPTWIARSRNFLKALFTLRLSETRQYRIPEAAHPGVTTMWLGSLGVILTKIAKILVNIPYSTELTLLKLPLVIFSSIIFLFDIIILYLLLGAPLAFLAGVFISLDPFFIGYTKLLHMDGILSLLMFTSIMTFIYAIQKDSARFILISGIFGGLSFLTKAPGFSLIPFIFLLSLFYPLSIKFKKQVEYSKSNLIRLTFSFNNFINALNMFCPWVLSSAVCFVLLWPSMWVDPVISVKSIFYAAERGVLETHKITKYVLDPLFYFKSILLFVSPLILTLFFAGLLLSFFKDREKNNLVLISVGFIIFFLAGMTLAAKKGERYILPLYPFVNVVAAFGYYFLISTLKVRAHFIEGILYLVPAVLLVIQAYYYHPYYLAYYNPLLAAPEKIGFGEGLEKAAQYLNDKESARNLTVSSWYPEVFAAYFEGTTVDLNRRKEQEISYIVLYRGMRGRPKDDGATLILEEFKDKAPEKTIYINNLEYVWVYKK